MLFKNISKKLYCAIQWYVLFCFVLFFFSPSGKLVQIEYALNAVAAGAPSVGIKASNGVVIATEKKHKSILYDEHSVHKVEPITKNIGMVYSGMGPDYRWVVNDADQGVKHKKGEYPSNQSEHPDHSEKLAWNLIWNIKQFIRTYQGSEYKF